MNYLEGGSSHNTLTVSLMASGWEWLQKFYMSSAPGSSLLVYAKLLPLAKRDFQSQVVANWESSLENDCPIL